MGIAALAILLLTRGKVGLLVRADLYAAVATILAFVLRMDAQGEQPPAEAPPTARYDESGRRAAG